jgi:hypothetical protein
MAVSKEICSVIGCDVDKVLRGIKSKKSIENSVALETFEPVIFYKSIKNASAERMKLIGRY